MLDGFAEDGYIIKMHVYRVRNAADAHNTLQRLDSVKEVGKRILLDLPSTDCEDLLKRVVGYVKHALVISSNAKIRNYM